MDNYSVKEFGEFAKSGRLPFGGLWKHPMRRKDSGAVEFFEACLESALEQGQFFASDITSSEGRFSAQLTSSHPSCDENRLVLHAKNTPFGYVASVSLYLPRVDHPVPVSIGYERNSGAFVPHLEKEKVRLYMGIERAIKDRPQSVWKDGTTIILQG